jgi:hypothetical protein
MSSMPVMEETRLGVNSIVREADIELVTSSVVD